MSRIAKQAFAVFLALALWHTALCQKALPAPDDVEPPPAAANENEQRVFIAEANFEQWVFQGRGNADAARQRLQSALKLQVDELHRICDLTAEQKQKLALSAEGDTKRFFDEVEMVREQFRAVQNDPNGFNQIWQDIQPLQRKLSGGLFDRGSFFAKTLRTTLTSEQAAKYDAHQEERRQYRYRAMVEVGITALENAVPLRHEQHSALVKMLLERSEPPEAFGQHDNYVIMHRLATLPEQEIKALLNERQYELFERQIDQYRNILPVLRQNGILIE